MRAGSLPLAGWAKSSFIDYPGTIATVLFFAGCNLRCPYCHNPSIVLDTATGRIAIDEVLAYLKERRNLIQGAVLSGGEPTLHAAIGELLPALREIGCRIKLDTNGLLPEMIQAWSPDYLALDFKTAPDLYPALLKAPYDDIPARLTRSLEIVRTMRNCAEVRITAAPGIVTPETITAIAPLLQGVYRVILQPLQTRTPLLDPSFAPAPYSAEVMEEMRQRIAGFAEKCVVRGG
jgi:pyruvate formate lyase activating enzyme